MRFKSISSAADEVARRQVSARQPILRDTVGTVVDVAVAPTAVATWFSFSP